MKALWLAVVPLVSFVAFVSCDQGPPAPAPQPDLPSEPFRFVDIAGGAGLSTVQVGGGPDVDWVIDSVGSGGAWLDYDNDGDADLYLAQGATDESPHAGPPDRLFRNDGDPDGDGVPSFTDVTAGAGVCPPHGATPIETAISTYIWQTTSSSPSTAFQPEGRSRQRAGRSSGRTCRCSWDPGA